jgi:twinkle protein
MSKDLISGDFAPLKARKITEETCKKFGYQVGEYNGKRVQIAPYFDEDGSMVAQKIRFPPNVDGSKDFTCFGSMKNAQLFGQRLWAAGGRKLVITEGEIDAMAVSQVQGNKWPVVSIRNGAQSAKKDIAAQLQWVSSFDEVILMFDNDEPGRLATIEALSILPTGKAKVAKLPLKDAGEMLVADKGDEIISAIWQAQAYRPDGVVSLEDIMDDCLEDVVVGLPWFTPALTDLTYGRRLGECYGLGAGTGIGKTDFLTQQITYDCTVLGEKVGAIFLEQKPRETAKRLAGKLGGKRFHIPREKAGWTKDELKESLEKLRDTGLFFYDSFGSTDWEVIRETIRFLAHSEGVRIFYLDHLTALAAAEDDEKKALEKIMAELAGLAQELNIIILFVSHLSTPEGKPHEEGGRVMIKHFKGSRAIGFWCHYMFGMERDQQNENQDIATTTTFRILKDRYTGDATGKLIYFGYDRETGLLYEREAPSESKSHGFRDETAPSGGADF